MNREEWYKNHKCCPECGSNEILTTLIGIAEVIGEDFEDNINTASCKCGWSGKENELVEESE